MRRRSRASSKLAKARSRKTVKRRTASKDVRHPGASAGHAAKVVRLTHERDEALEQQAATAEVLKAISRSTFDLQPVFDSIAENAVRLCEAERAFIYRFDGEFLRAVAYYNVGPELRQFVDRNPIAPGQKTISARAALKRRTVHIADIQADPDIAYLVRDVEPIRTIIAVPMLKGDDLVGMITIYRLEVKPFTNKQVALIETFADQAVIAIENTRLLNELRRRTTDLTESLEQQTATSEVLKVISSSPGDLQPVFEAMLANATRLCEAKFGVLYRSEGDALRAVALYGAPLAYAEERRRNPIVRPHPETTLGRAVATKRTVQMADVLKVPHYFDPPSGYTSPQLPKLAGARTVLAVPMCKDDELVGIIAIYRQEVRPFTDKQTELLTNFAAQAVIAIENARLLNELRQRTTDLTESLEQQTATSKVLEVISRSAFDLQAVFETVAESSVRLCGADRALVFRFDGELLRIAVAFNAPQELKDFIVHNPFGPGRHNAAGRAALERRTVQILDPLADPEYSYGAKDIEKIGTILAVPILKGEDLLGVINIFHLDEVRLFTDKQIALVETFADQAAIAIDNVRLLDELRQSLQQQTATADVLKVISRSTFDLQAVLDTLIELAARLCEADIAVVHRQQGTNYQAVANFGGPPDYRELILRMIPFEAAKGSVLGRTVLERKPVQVADVLADPEYSLHEVQKMVGFRTSLGVPLLREGHPIGAIVLMRLAVWPFTNKQIELASTFADQAVIAIENVRLFEAEQQRTRELSESLQQQTATADVLKVISRSTFDLKTVLNTLVEFCRPTLRGGYGGHPSSKRLGLFSRRQSWRSE